MFDLSQLDLIVMANDSEHRGYLEAAADGQLVLQRCSACELFRAAKGAACPFCSSLTWSWSAVSGTGSIYSYQIVPRAVHPAFAAWVPYPVVLVELDEQRRVPWPRDMPAGTVSLRIVGNLCRWDDPSQPADERELAIGLRVEVCFRGIDERRSLPQFRLNSERPEHSPWQAP